jgi:predicted CXXCH cytochrome family protein
MRSLIRFVTRTASGASESRDKLHEGDVLTLGRATDQVLHLKDRRVALEHARIAKRGSHIVLSALADAAVMVNGALVRETRLAVGDTIEIGANRLTLIEPPAGIDLALTFELEASAPPDEIAPTARVLRLADTALAKRWPAWTLAGIAVLFGLLIPAAGLLSPGGRASLHRVPLPDDGWWSSGPLALAHHKLEARCESCHERAFVRVRDQACLTCHSSMLHRHAAAHGVRVDLEQRRCATCHAEHNEPTLLIRRDDELCSGCHADIRATVAGAGRVTSGNATDFLLEHPDFSVARRENTGLKFAHDVHLDARGIRSPTGKRVLACSSCHTPEPGGARMRPIRMERDCIECHRLDFDPAEPERQVPHGSAQGALTTLIEYYSAKYLQGYPDPLAATPGAEWRHPGARLSTEERAATMRRARDKALSVARDLFERRTCATCHTVERSNDGSREVSWSVAPVTVTAAWMPNARFDHGRHGTALTRCATCHDAADSKRADDVLMPSIAVCRTCHAGARPPADRPLLIASGCATCHAFHRPTEPLWQSAAAQRSVAR